MQQRDKSCDDKAHTQFKKKPSRSHEQHLKYAKRNYRQEVRKYRVDQGVRHDETMFSIIGKNPKKLYDYVRSSKKNSTVTSKLTVGDKTYTGESVPDGFFDSMTQLKYCDMNELKEDPELQVHFSNYEHKEMGDIFCLKLLLLLYFESFILS